MVKLYLVSHYIHPYIHTLVMVSYIVTQLPWDGVTEAKLPDTDQHQKATSKVSNCSMVINGSVFASVDNKPSLSRRNLLFSQWFGSIPGNQPT